jgi:hypothetical protein
MVGCAFIFVLSPFAIRGIFVFSLARNGQPILQAKMFFMMTRPPSSHPVKGRRALPGVLVLALVLLAAIWAVSTFNAEARVHRKVVRLIRLAEKPGAESPVALGLAANRFGQLLATNCVLEWEPDGELAAGRQTIVQLFVQVRSNLDRMEIQEPRIRVATVRRREVQARVEARYRFADGSGAAAENPGWADLHWVKGREGWQITRATLGTDAPGSIPGGWK